MDIDYLYYFEIILFGFHSEQGF